MKVNNLENAKKILRNEMDFLIQKYGVSEIGIFGSFVFSDFSEKSDIDILVSFKKPIGLFKFMELENYLAKKMGRKVDLVSKDGLKTYIKSDILNSAIYV